MLFNLDPVMRKENKISLRIETLLTATFIFQSLYVISHCVAT